MIRKLLNLNLTMFSIDMYTKIQNPIDNYSLWYTTNVRRKIFSIGF